jgi:hypothetical protein
MSDSDPKVGINTYLISSTLAAIIILIGRRLYEYYMG